MYKDEKRGIKSSEAIYFTYFQQRDSTGEWVIGRRCSCGKNTHSVSKCFHGGKGHRNDHGK